MSKRGKYDDVFDAAKFKGEAIGGAIIEEPATEAGPPAEDVAARPEAPKPAESNPPALPHEPPARSPGRPKGKRSDDNYTQVCGYVPTETYKRVRKILRNLEPEQQFSDLMASLLSDWLANQTGE